MDKRPSKERQMWEAFPAVYARLHKDDVGYPPKEWEELKAEPTNTDAVYRLKNIPFFAKGLAIEDEVLTHSSAEGYSPVIQSIHRRGGFSTVRLSIRAKEDPNWLVDWFTKRGCKIEFCREIRSLVAVAIPKSNFEEVYEYILSEMHKGRWDAEDGFIAVDEDAKGNG